MAVLGLRFCARAFPSCGKWGPLFIAVRGPLTIAASLVAEHRLQMRRLSNCGSRAQLLRGMWDLPRPGLGPVSPALAGRFLTTAPAGKSLPVSLKEVISYKKINLFIYLFQAALGLRCCTWAFSSCGERGRGYSLLWCAGFSLRWLLLLQSTGSRCAGFSSCGMWAQQLWLVGSRAQAQQLWCTGLVALLHVGSSQTRA